ncbi:MAG: hypothetical protein E7437_00040 [Ruminococcaceae bacterium]|nr:hypothetical protein [Oscillospiraceae bacterium]
MSDKALHKLKVLPEFKNLIRPLKKKEYLQLEANILSDGCRDPIVVWKRYIIDGHNRYEICTRHNIPFEVIEMEFECKEAVLAWICANQLGRRNITEETRKFLIGMQYETEKIAVTKRNAAGLNQYNLPESESSFLYDDDDEQESPRSIPSGHFTAQKIAEENHISQGTVQKYAMYTRALEEIGKVCPTIVPKILAGMYKISHKNLLELSRMEPSEMRKVVRKLEVAQQPFVQYNKTRREIQPPSSNGKAQPVQKPSVKDMPVYDPDAEITGLTLTIPSWSSSIERTKNKADLSSISNKARNHLIEALAELQIKIEDMLDAIKED